MLDLFLIFISACLVNNLILDGMLGVAPAMALSRKIDVAAGMATTMVFVLMITSLFSYPLKFYLLVPLHLEYLELITYIAVIPLAVVLSLKGLKKIKPVLAEEIKLFLPLALMNTAVLGIALLNVQADYGLLGSLLFGAGSGVGFGMILIVIAAMQERINVADIPAPFRGISIMLITLGILSMAFMGFIGLGVQ